MLFLRVKTFEVKRILKKSRVTYKDEKNAFDTVQYVQSKKLTKKFQNANLKKVVQNGIKKIQFAKEAFQKEVQLLVN